MNLLCKMIKVNSQILNNLTTLTVNNKRKILFNIISDHINVKKMMISFAGGPHPVASRLGHEEGGEEVFTPASGRSPHSSLSSPQVSVDSPRICFSPLRIKDSIEEEDETGHVIHR